MRTLIFKVGIAMLMLGVALGNSDNLSYSFLLIGGGMVLMLMGQKGEDNGESV